MVQAALLVLSLAVCAGLALALWHMRGSGNRNWPISVGCIAHGLIGAAGLAVLVLAVRGPPRGVASGSASFGSVSAVLLATALVLGIAIPLSARWWRRTGGLLIAAHAGIAITGYVIFLAWVALP